MKAKVVFSCQNPKCRRCGVKVKTDMTCEELRVTFSHPLECSACCTPLKEEVKPCASVA